MPLYVYACGTCGSKSEHLRSFAERLEPATCAECSSEARFALSLSAPSLVGAMTPDACHGGAPGSTGCCGGGACGTN
jgi:putative FmdB family regulatory protein